MAGRPMDRVGDTIGYLTLIADTGKRRSNGNVIWLCECVCGKRLERCRDSLSQSLKFGFKISCGCKIDKSIGKKFAHDQKRIEKTVIALGQTEGTTMQGIGEQKLRKNNHSGYRGVSFDKRTNKWKARLTLRQSERETKCFDNIEDAIAWRKHLEEKYYEPIKARYEGRKNGKAD